MDTTRQVLLVILVTNGPFLSFYPPVFCKELSNTPTLYFCHNQRFCDSVKSINSMTGWTLTQAKLIFWPRIPPFAFNKARGQVMFKKSSWAFWKTSMRRNKGFLQTFKINFLLKILQFEFCNFGNSYKETDKIDILKYFTLNVSFYTKCKCICSPIYWDQLMQWSANQRKK